MAKISIWLDTRKANKKGEFPIKIVIVVNRTNTSISTGVSVRQEHYIGEVDKVVRSQCPNSKTINSGIEALYARCFEKIKEFEFNGIINTMSAAQIREAIIGKKKEEQVEKQLFFVEYAKQYADKVTASTTRMSIYQTLGRLKQFYKREDYVFADITPKALSDIDYYYNNLSSATRGIMFRNIRAIFNKAINEDLVDANLYPFKKFKIKSYTPQKDFMPIECFCALQDLKLEGRMAEARDFFLLSFYLCGINPVDLYNAESPMNNKLRYERTKTQRHGLGSIILSIPPEAQVIIDKYKGETHLLSFCEKRSCFETALSNYRKELKKIGQMIGFPNLSFYYARYSWATYALNYCDVPEYIISKALGHSDKTTATKYYIAFDWAKVDVANRKVIDYTNQSH